MLELPNLNAPPGMEGLDQLPDLSQLGVERMGPPKPKEVMGPPRPTEEAKSFSDVMAMGGEETTSEDDGMKDKIKALGEFMQMSGAGGGGTLAGAAGGVMQILGASGEDWASIGQKIKGLF